MDSVLKKIFADGFYKVNSGFLVFLFAVLLSYCFFINTAGDITLLSPGKVLYYNFIMLINFAGNPIIAIIFFAGWFAYTVKSWYYVLGQFSIVHHQFIFYSSTSFTKIQQFKSWFYVQLIISLPFVFYVLVASITGIIFHHYAVALAICFFSLLLIAASAVIYVYQVNDLFHQNKSSRVFTLTGSWPKPLFSLFVFYILNRLKLTFILTKILSYLVIVSIMFSLADVKGDLRVAAFIVPGIVIAHAVIIYQQHKFESVYFSIARNLPLSMPNNYIQYLSGHILLFLPEAIWLLASFTVFNAIGLMLLMWGIIMLIHCLLYRIGLQMNKYLPWVLGLFFTISVFILFGWVWPLIPGCFIISFLLFSANYYQPATE